MDEKQIIETIVGLSHSQGFYGRLYERMMDAKENDPDAYAEFMDDLVAQKFASPLELVIYIEE